MESCVAVRHIPYRIGYAVFGVENDIAESIIKFCGKILAFAQKICTPFDVVWIIQTVGKISLRTVAEIAEKVGKYGIVRINAVDEKFNALDSIGELILHRFIAG